MKNENNFKMIENEDGIDQNDFNFIEDITLQSNSVLLETLLNKKQNNLRR